MRDTLAEQLLAEVMGWEALDIARERPRLQAIAAYKYDEYQQFSPGMRFVESLAVWLNQFATLEERRIAFDFVMRRLIFCSTAEMNHLVAIAYPDHVRPVLLRLAALDEGLNPRHVARVARTLSFRERQRRCLFLGLSDGARMDVFRRANPELSHEQVWQTYEVGSERAGDLLRSLCADLAQLWGRTVPNVEARFGTVVLLDDFSASGISYIRRELDGSWKGKVSKFVRSITDPNSDVCRLVDPDDLKVLIVLYMATEQARQHIARMTRDLQTETGVECDIAVVHLLRNDVRVLPEDGDAIHALIDQYYDHSIHDEHMEKGDTTDSRYGFAACGLPLVLNHNTPNNSIALLWSYDETDARGLFPRVQRHKEFR